MAAFAGERVGPVPSDADHHAGVPAAELHLQRVQQHAHRHDRGVQDGSGRHEPDSGRQHALGAPLSAALILRQIQVGRAWWSNGAPLLTR